MAGAGTGRSVGDPGRQLGRLRRDNVSRVLRELLRAGAVSRADLAAQVGLSRAAVTGITGDLIAAGLVAEGAAASSSGGRPRTPLHLNLERLRLLGVHIGVRRASVGLIDLSGGLVAVMSQDHESTAPEAVRRVVHEQIEALSAAAGHDQVLGIGVTAGGAVSTTDGVIVSYPNLDWRDVPIALPPDVRRGRPVSYDSSVRAWALYEARLGEARGSRSSLCLFAGNVVGSAFVLDGEIDRGHRSAAGAVDHLPAGLPGEVACRCGRLDCLWALGSDDAMLQRARLRGITPAAAAFADLLELATTDADVRALHHERAAAVGSAAAVLAAIFDPEVVVVGGSVLTPAECFPTLLDAARARTTSDGPTAPVLRGGVRETRSLIQAAGALALETFLRDPLGPRTD
jgi:predicted NBD/HSP70 family sugar kinase